MVNFFYGMSLIFVYLKMTGQLEWSWWLVLLPAYLPAVTLLLLVVWGAVISAQNK